MKSSHIVAIGGEFCLTDPLKQAFDAGKILCKVSAGFDHYCETEQMFYQLFTQFRQLKLIP